MVVEAREGTVIRHDLDTSTLGSAVAMFALKISSVQPPAFRNNSPDFSPLWHVNTCVVE